MTLAADLTCPAMPLRAASPPAPIGDGASRHSGRSRDLPIREPHLGEPLDPSKFSRAAHRPLFHAVRTCVRSLATSLTGPRMTGRGRGGILGIRARFRSWWASARGGSSPSARISGTFPRLGCAVPAEPGALRSGSPLGQWPNWLRHRSPKPAIPGSSPGCPVRFAWLCGPHSPSRCGFAGSQRFVQVQTTMRRHIEIGRGSESPPGDAGHGVTFVYGFGTASKIARSSSDRWSRRPLTACPAASRSIVSATASCWHRARWRSQACTCLLASNCAEISLS